MDAKCKLKFCQNLSTIKNPKDVLMLSTDKFAILKEIPFQFFLDSCVKFAFNIYMKIIILI